MTTQDLNQLTISGHVRSEPQLHRYDDGDIACTLTLTHTTDHHQSGHWELQLYHVSLWGDAAVDFAETFCQRSWEFPTCDRENSSRLVGVVEAGSEGLQAGAVVAHAVAVAVDL
jgi:hypothetical protein